MIYDSLSVSSLLDRFLRLDYARGTGEDKKTFSILAVGSFPQTQASSSRPLPEDPFSILAVGSFPQTLLFENVAQSGGSFSILAVGSFPQTTCDCVDTGYKAILSVSSLLDRFLRRQFKNVRFGLPLTFQYPRCWIVSSDGARRPHGKPSAIFQYPRCWIVSSDNRTVTSYCCLSCLSVSSLLDRFLRRHALMGPVWRHQPFSILAVGSFPQTFFRLRRPPPLRGFQYPRCWIVSSDLSVDVPGSSTL